jgi:hypothetical protein
MTQYRQRSLKMTDPDNPNPSFTTTLRIRTALTVFLVLLSIALSSCNRDPKSMIVGKWITLDGKESLQFFPDGTMAIATTAGANYTATFSLPDAQHLRVELGGFEALAGPQLWTIALSSSALTITLPNNTVAKYKRAY